MATKPRIVRTPDTCGGKPRLDGTRLTTEWFRQNVESAGRGFVKAHWPYLTDADIDAALAYERLPHRRLRRLWRAAQRRVCARVCDGCGERP